MDEILDLYGRSYDKRRPLVCIDEKSYQLLDHEVRPIAMRPGRPAKLDSHYVRKGTCSIFVAIEPLTGHVFTFPREQRTRADYCDFMRELEAQYPEDERILIVQDNLNTHNFESFYKNLPPEQAEYLASRFEFHFTPVKGSWLNMCEIDISALSRQCLKRRLPSLEVVESEVLLRDVLSSN